MTPPGPPESDGRIADDRAVPSPPADDHSIGGVLLAAGGSRRFGEANKLLVEIDGEAMVSRAARTLVAADLDPIIVVIGHEPAPVRAALSDLPVRIVVNPASASGQSTSVRAGIAAIDGDSAIDAVVIALGDMPYVRPASIRTLIRAYRDGAGDVLAAAYQGERGNPVLFDSRYFETLASVQGDAGARSVVIEHGVLVETDDPGVRMDIDTPSDVTG